MSSCSKLYSTLTQNRHVGLIRKSHLNQARQFSGISTAILCLTVEIFLAQGKVPLLSVNAIHQLHIFIFALAVTHVFLSLLTVLLGFLKVRV